MFQYVTVGIHQLLTLLIQIDKINVLMKNTFLHKLIILFLQGTTANKMLIADPLCVRTHSSN